MVDSLRPFSVMASALHIKRSSRTMFAFGGDDAKTINPDCHTHMVGYECEHTPQGVGWGSG